MIVAGCHGLVVTGHVLSRHVRHVWACMQGPASSRRANFGVAPAGQHV